MLFVFGVTVVFVCMCLLILVCYFGRAPSSPSSLTCARMSPVATLMGCPVKRDYGWGIRHDGQECIQRDCNTYRSGDHFRTRDECESMRLKCI